MEITHDELNDIYEQLVWLDIQTKSIDRYVRLLQTIHLLIRRDMRKEIDDFKLALSGTSEKFTEEVIKKIRSEIHDPMVETIKILGGNDEQVQ